MQFFDPRPLKKGIPQFEPTDSSQDEYGVIHLVPAVALPAYVEKAQLILMSARSDQGLDLSQPENWDVLEIDDGGWDLDAILNNDLVHSVYRRDPYWVSLRDPDKVNPQITSEQDLPIPSSLADDEPYPSLYLRAISVPDNAIVPDDSYDDVPGGAHPRIQSLDPLLLTADRVAHGKLRMNPPHTETVNTMMGPIEREFPLLASPHIETLTKIVILRRLHDWAKGELPRTPFELIPRSLVHGSGWASREWMTEIIDSTANFASINDFHPVWVVRAEEVEAPPETGLKSALEVDLLHHDVPYESLAVTRFLIGTGASELSTSRTGEVVLDINHGQIRSNLTPSATAENRQFRPFIQSGFTLDNTVGGCVIRDRTTRSLSFYGYTDLGDAGSRIVYDEDLPDPDPLPIGDQKGMDPASVEGTGCSADEWVEWDISDWQETKLPSYPVQLNLAGMIAAGLIELIIALLGGEDVDIDVTKLTTGSIGSGLQPVLDSLVELYHYFIEQGANPIVLGADEITQLEEVIGDFYPDLDLEELLWTPYDQMNFNDPDSAVEFTLCHTSLVIDKYRIEHFLDDSLDRDRVEIHTLPEHHTSYRGHHVTEGQGELGFRFDLEFSTDDILVSGPGTDVLTIDKVTVKISYSRRFTPGVLMSEIRSEDPLLAGAGSSASDSSYEEPQELVEGLSSVLATKPHSNTEVTVESVDLDTSISFINLAYITTIALLLTGLGLAIALVIMVLWTGSQAAANIPPPWGPIIVLAIIATIVTLILFVVPGLVRAEIKRRIRKELEKESFRQSLDNTGLMTYAGEGLAETLARRVIEKVNDSADPLPFGLDASGEKGRNRFIDQFWQTVHVTGEKCRVLIRR